MTYTLAELSRCAHTIASWSASQRQYGTWDGCYFWALRRMGFELVPIEAGVELGDDGPVMAPMPSQDGAYPWPSVVASAGWQPTPATQHGSQSEPSEHPLPQGQSEPI